MVACPLERNIVMLIKTMSMGHLNSTFETGTFCFCYPGVFNSTQNDLASGQQDKWDAHIGLRADKSYVALNGRLIQMTDATDIHLISGKSQKTPLCSFRKVEVSELRHDGDVYRLVLGDTVDRIKAEFRHNAFIAILNYRAFIKRIAEKYSCYARSVHYGEIDEEYFNFLEESKKRGFAQADMFQKGIDYAWQKEYRVLLPPEDNLQYGKKLIQIGPIGDIAIGGGIEALRDSVFIRLSKEELELYDK